MSPESKCTGLFSPREYETFGQLLRTYFMNLEAYRIFVDTVGSHRCVVAKKVDGEIKYVGETESFREARSLIFLDLGLKVRAVEVEMTPNEDFNPTEEDWR